MRDPKDGSLAQEAALFCFMSLWLLLASLSLLLLQNEQCIRLMTCFIIYQTQLFCVGLFGERVQLFLSAASNKLKMLRAKHYKTK